MGVEPDLVVVRKSPALNRFHRFINSLDAEDEVDNDELQEIRASFGATDRPLYHLLLVAHSNHREIQDAFNGSKKVDVVSQILDILVDLDDELKIRNDVYLDIVVGLGLTEEYMAMMVAHSQSAFMMETVENLVSKLLDENEIEKNILQTFTIEIVKLSRVMDKEECMQKYQQGFSMLARHSLSASSGLNDFDKLVLTFRVICISLLAKNDYLEDSEAGKLMQEWQLNKTPVELKSVKVYEAIFKKKSKDWLDGPLASEILFKLDEILGSETMFNEEKFTLDFDVQKNYCNMGCVSYIGGCAYLVNLISEKKGGIISKFANLSNLVKYWIKKKPKMKLDDFELLESENFSYFCAILDKISVNSHKSQAIYSQDWVKKFLVFSANDIIGSEEGSMLAERVIVGAPQDVLLKYLTKVSEFEGEMSTKQRLIVLKILTKVESSEEETVERINIVFSKGSNDKLRLEDYVVSLNTLSSQLNTIEFEKDCTKLAKHKQEVLRICSQNPTETISRLLEQSVRTEHFRALIEFARPFFPLTFTMAKTNESDEEAQLPDTVIAVSYLNLLSSLPKYPDSLYKLFMSGTKKLMAEKVLCIKEIFDLLKYQIISTLKREHITLGVATGLAILLREVVFLISPNIVSMDKDQSELLKDVATFVLMLNRVFTSVTQNKTYTHAMTIRTQLTEILNYLKPLFLIESKNIVSELESNFDDITTVRIGILYAKCESLRPVIAKLVEKEKSFQDLPLQEFSRIAMVWGCNLCEAEWIPLIEFLFVAVKTAKCRFKELHIINGALHLAYAMSIDLSSSNSFLHMLKFYEYTLKQLKSKGEFNNAERKSITDTLMILLFSMTAPVGHIGSSFRRHKEAVGLFQILTCLLGVVQEPMVENIMNDSWRKDLLDKLNNLETLDNKCEPVRMLLQNQLNSS